MKILQLSPQEAARELLARRKARRSAVEFARYIEVPGAPSGSIDLDDDAYTPVQTSLADHHELILNACQECIEEDYGRLMLFFPPGSAKALALDTPIPTPTGWKNIGDLRVGDRVLDENGKPCDVTWVSPVWKSRPVYTVTTDCGDTIVADRDHEWLVRICGKHGVHKIKETHQLAKKRSKRPMIARAKALELPQADLPVDPYLLGQWLGNGHSDGIRITSHQDDVAWIRGELKRLGYETSDSSKYLTYGVLNVRHAFVALDLVNAAHGAIGRKHIPEVFLRASHEQRLALLQGLIDSDGTVCKERGCATFCNTNLELALQTRELVRSLGVKAGWSESRAILNGKDFGPCYRVSFYHESAARLPRKAVLCRNQYRTPNTYVDVEPAGNADTVCIEVNSPSHLFLCGRSMTPTHNSTYGSVVIPAWIMGQKPNYRMIGTSYGSDLARKMGRRTRSIIRQSRYQTLFSTSLSNESSAADEWALTNGSEYMSGGILSGITGNRADCLIIDDPIKGRQEADSDVIRKRVMEAYQDDILTRLKPGGSIIIIQTRWHEADLAGQILPEGYAGESGRIKCRDGHVWNVLCVPAQCERDDDILGRKVGDFIWPEWFPPEHWDTFKRIPRTWSALYQQRPAPDDGDYFKREWIHAVDVIPTVENMYIYGGSDYAVTASGGDYTVHVIIGVDSNDNLYLLDMWRGKASSDVWVEEFCRLVKKWSPIGWAEETGQIRSGVGPFLTKRQIETGAYVYREVFPTRGDKAIRAQSFRGRIATHGLRISRDAPWLADLTTEFMQFPVGSHDDIVDACGLVGQLLDKMLTGAKPPVEKPDNTMYTLDNMIAQPIKPARRYGR